MVIKPRDRELLSALVQKVRLFSQKQIAEHWWSGETANARRRMKILVQAGLVKRTSVAARTLPPIQNPIVNWQPGQTDPEFGQVSYQLQSRWYRRAVRPTTIFVATEKACQHFGGRSRGQLKRPLQATHDLGVSEIWLSLSRQAPAWAKAWVGEDLLAHTRRGEKLPDAFIVNEAREAAWVIEFGGAYDSHRLEDFHNDCADREIPYQVW